MLDTILPGDLSAPQPPLRLLGLEALLTLPQHDGDASYIQDIFAAFLHDQGLIQGPLFDAQPNRPEPPPPPHREYRVHELACDLDGDGVTDMIGNERTLWFPPFDDVGPTRLRAVSGATGETLWLGDEKMMIGHLVLPGGVDYTPHGEGIPRRPTNTGMAADLDGDGVCDLVTVGLTVDGDLRPPLITVAAHTDFSIHVKGISGATGEEIWRTSVAGSWTFVQDPTRPWPLGTYSAQIRDLPTGFLSYSSPSGPKVVLKTTDLDYTWFFDTYASTGNFYTSADVTERIRLFDASGGELIWMRDLAGAEGEGATNIAWLAGVADFAGDAEPEILLHHLTITTPRSSEQEHPITGEKMYRYARGMRVTALKGEIAAAGELLWSVVILDPLRVRPRADVEENFEHLAWTHASIIGDIRGDGRPTPLASYVAKEEVLPGTTNGRFRTHFIPLDPATGEPRWDVRQQGWGFMHTLADHDHAPNLVGIGMVDLPTLPPPGGRFPPKFIRIAVLEGDTGATLWTHERLIAQNSYLSYNLALSQFRTALAPYDWTGDGLRDFVTPSQSHSASRGNDQVLISTASHTYDVLNAADGSILRTLSVWGPEGKVLACKDSQGHLTVVSGHARRLDITRFNVQTGHQEWRRPIWNDPAPLAATAGKDVLGLGATCAEDGPGRTQISVNVQAYSFLRGHEVIAVRGFVGDSAAMNIWIDPTLRGDPPTSSVFEPHSLGPPAPFVGWATGILVGVAAGAMSATAILILRRRNRLGMAAGIALLLLISASAVVPLAEASAPDALLHRSIQGSSSLVPSAPIRSSGGEVEIVVDEPAPSAVGSIPQAMGETDHAGAVLPETPYLRFLLDLQNLGGRWTPQDHIDLVRTYYRAMGFATSDDTKDRFEEDAVLSFTHEIGDIDGDGIDDFLLDEYCIDLDSCPGSGGDAVDFLLDWTVRGRGCGPPHHLWAVSGADGSVVWNRSLDHGLPVVACGTTFVLGIVPLANGSGVLLYDYVIETDSPYYVHAVVLHTFYVLDVISGERVWTFEEVGAYSALTHSARNILINPVLQTGLGDGIQAISSDSYEGAFFLQGVGYQRAVVSSGLPPPGSPSALIVVRAYKPVEWAARIDLETGQVTWREDTFTPEPRRTVIPATLDVPPFFPRNLPVPPFIPSNALPRAVEPYYWRHSPCCFDNTGDRIPDLLFRTVEWSDTPLANPDGPHHTDARLMLLKGANGEIAFDLFLLRDVARNPFLVRAEAVGDVDNDGTHDFLVHVLHFESDYRHVLSMRSGADGSELWNATGPRMVRAYVVGDANDNGGNDLLLVDWYGAKMGWSFSDDYAEPQRLPLRLVSGADGTTLWRVDTYAAPTDVVFALDTQARNGFPDFDGDGVADIFIDDPMFLGDQTVIHRQSVISGRDARSLFAVENVGAFAYAVRLPDITGDGRDDFAMINGDVGDLWLSTYSGEHGRALWSIRLLALPVSNYASALPNIQVHAIRNAQEVRSDFLINFHLYVETATRTTYISSNGPTELVRIVTTLTPQILRLDGLSGRVGWGFPAVDHAVMHGATRGSSPATTTWLEISTAPQSDLRADAFQHVTNAIPSLAAYAAAFVLTLGVGAFAARTKRPREEVPDLE